MLKNPKWHQKYLNLFKRDGQKVKITNHKIAKSIQSSQKIRTRFSSTATQ